MLKRDITYKDYSDPPKMVTETFYFNLNEAEIIEMQFSVEEGFGEYLQRIHKEQNRKEILALWKRLVGESFGERSEDGRHFDKSPELSRRFLQSAAYNSLFMEVLQNDNAAIEFITGIMPEGLAEQAAAAAPKERPPVTIVGATAPIAPLIPPAPPTS